MPGGKKTEKLLYGSALEDILKNMPVEQMRSLSNELKYISPRNVNMLTVPEPKKINSDGVPKPISDDHEYDRMITQGVLNEMLRDEINNIPKVYGKDNKPSEGSVANPYFDVTSSTTLNTEGADESTPAESSDRLDAVAKYFQDYQDAINENRVIQSQNKNFNDAITLKELLNNLNQEISPGVSLANRVSAVRRPELDTSAYERMLTMSENAAIRNMRDNGMSYLIPAISARTNNAKAEFLAGLASQKMQADVGVDQANAQLEAQTEHLNKNIELQNEQSSIAQDAMIGEAISKNMQALRNNNSVYNNSLTQNRDNQLRLNLMTLINKYPALAENLAFLGLSNNNNNS